jgi:hypothetical protein
MSFSRIALIFAALLSTFAMACGSESKSADEPIGGPDTMGILLLRADENFTLDAFVAAGFKKSKEFSNETVPEATSIWYGFYSQRDIEVRFYPDHETAKGAGRESAAAAIGRSPNSNIGGGIITSAGNRTQYNDYLVAGNAVLLCQTDIVPCKELAEKLAAGN